MRVATYNVHDCVGIDGRYDPERIIAVVNELDAELVALQEITLDADGQLLSRLEEATGMHAMDGTLFERGIGRYGNLLLSRNSLVDGALHLLPESRREQRGVIETCVDLQGREVRVLATHLGLARRERRTQIARLAELCAAPGSPVLLLGDLNVWMGGSELTPLLRTGFLHRPVRSFPTRPFALMPLDRVLAQAPLRIHGCHRHASPLALLASDHFPVVAELGREEQGRSETPGR